MKKPKMRGYINLKKVNKDLLVYKGDAIWLNLTIWESDYENTDYDISQSANKEQRDKGLKGKGIGAMNIYTQPAGGSESRDEEPPDDDNLPF
jgi:hypothetical protein